MEHLEGCPKRRALTGACTCVPAKPLVKVYEVVYNPMLDYYHIISMERMHVVADTNTLAAAIAIAGLLTTDLQNNSAPF